MPEICYACEQPAVATQTRSFHMCFNFSRLCSGLTTLQGLHLPSAWAQSLLNIWISIRSFKIYDIWSQAHARSQIANGTLSFYPISCGTAATFSHFVPTIFVTLSPSYSRACHKKHDEKAWVWGCDFSCVSTDGHLASFMWQETRLGSTVMTVRPR